MKSRDLYTIRFKQMVGQYTLPETKMAPENGWLEYKVPFGTAYFQVLC